MDMETIESYEDLVVLMSKMEDIEEIVQCLRENRLIRRLGQQCCGKRMQERRLTSDIVYGRTWRCVKCGKRKRMLADSFFGASHLRPFTILKMAFLYVQNCNEYQMKAFMKDVPTPAPIRDWTQFFRDVMSKEIIRELRGMKMGGRGKVVIIDKTKLSKSKCNGGRVRHREQSWILGMYDVESKVGTLEFIQNFSQGEIIPRIQAQIEEGTTVHTDEHLAYRILGSLGYDHRTVRSGEFIASDGVHTNHAKAYFSRLKKFLRRKNVLKLEKIPSYLDEFMWSERHRDSPWKDFLKAVKRQYRFY